MADSFTVDFHKLGFCACPSSMFVTRSWSELRTAFRPDDPAERISAFGENPMQHHTIEAIDQMKPHPALVLEALDAVGGRPSRAALVGNSPSDIQAAHQAGVASIGHVDRPAKWRSLASATALVASLDAIVSALEPA